VQQSERSGFAQVPHGFRWRTHYLPID
jgi:hypothetical protein